MLAELFSAIKSVFGSTPTDRADDVERFRARSRLRSRQQRVGRKCASPDPADEHDEEEDDDTHRRRKVARGKAAVRPADKRLLSTAHAYTASTYQSYLAPPAVFDDGVYPDSPVVHEHQVLMMNAFDFAASPEAFLYDDDALYADGGSGGQQENRSLWRRRFSSAASDSARTPRLSPKLGSDALWASHFADDAAVDKLRAEADAHLHACYCPSETPRGLYYD